MPTYNFTSDLRISMLPSRIETAAKEIINNDLSTDKSASNNRATLAFFFNLVKGTNTLNLAANGKITEVVRNFVLKFQFPNTYTIELFNKNKEENLLVAPLRECIKILAYQYLVNNNTNPYLTFDEIRYWIFVTPDRWINANSKTYSETIKEILSNREISFDYAHEIEAKLSWKQYERQSRELISIIPYACDAFSTRNGILALSMPTPLSDKFADYIHFLSNALINNAYWNCEDMEYDSTTKESYIKYMDINGNVELCKQSMPRLSLQFDEASDNLKSLVQAIRTKPFVLLAGISGTGKSRIVRKLAQACWEPGSDEANAHKPSNFEMVQVKPNWHDSSELIGYVSRIGNKPQFIAGDFLKFIAKAWENPHTPYFLCLDEMNLAPVEQYFAEYLSVVESRKLQDNGKTIVSDPLMKKEDEEWYHTLIASITTTEEIRNQFLTDGIALPQNLIVVGTVNMDETTYSFSRKVLDRAMTIEMNEVDLRGGLHKTEDVLPHIEPAQFLADAVEGFDVYEQNQESCDKAIAYLGAVNKILDKTPFKVAYRTRNEFLIYTVNALKLAGENAETNTTIANALDEVTSMKILSRIEGDKRKVGFLPELKQAIKTGLAEIDGAERSEENSMSLSKLYTMGERLKSGYTSFWD